VGGGRRGSGAQAILRWRAGRLDAGAVAEPAVGCFSQESRHDVFSSALALFYGLLLEDLRRTDLGSPDYLKMFLNSE
jgi:hypothetical protein